MKGEGKTALPFFYYLHAMKINIFRISCLFLFVCLLSCKKNNPPAGMIQIISVKIGTTTLIVDNTVKNIPNDKPVQVAFNTAVDTNSIKKVISIKNSAGAASAYSYTSQNNSALLTLVPNPPLQNASDFTMTISSSLKGKNGETFPGVMYHFTTLAGTMAIDSISLNGKPMTATPLLNIDPKNIAIKVTFSQPLDPATYKSSFFFTGPTLSYSLSGDNRTVLATNTSKAKGFTGYSFSISSSLTSDGGYTFAGSAYSFFTRVDSTYQYPLISDDDLLTLIERQTFKYFWDFGHPSCGMARERNSSGNVVTIGGSGFGIMAMIVGMERGFITRADGIARLDKILGFLETCDRFHGAWPHWLNGVTGIIVPFSPHDNGGDLVETSYMIQGLLCMRQYLDSTVTAEETEINRINNLFKAVEFDWYTNGQNMLYWAWSPNYGYNLRIEGYNETLITYVVAASSPTHTITADVYTNGYANNGGIKNGRTYYGYVLPLGQDYGGPLFFTQYSFLGLDPRNLKDQYADYWQQNVNQSLINWSYCNANPRKYPGYGGAIWGLTASDNPWGYNAHSPTNDLGVITPTAAISSIAYTPVQSLEAAKTFYYFLGDHLWGDYGFYDAFDVTEGWWATSTLAIDQGPIICMIENYRTGLLWNLFMSAPEVKSGLAKLGFTW
jgi:hypothetical protein